MLKSKLLHGAFAAALLLASTIAALPQAAGFSANGVPVPSTVGDQVIVGPNPGQFQDEKATPAPTYASGGCTTTPSIAGSPFAFTYTQGASGCSGSTLTLTLPTAGYNQKWICNAHDITVPTTTFVEQSGGTATTVTFTNYTRTTGAPLTWVASDVLLIECNS